VASVEQTAHRVHLDDAPRLRRCNNPTVATPGVRFDVPAPCLRQPFRLRFVEERPDRFRRMSHARVIWIDHDMREHRHDPPMATGRGVDGRCNEAAELTLGHRD
jgi:hypothetical protein